MWNESVAAHLKGSWSGALTNLGKCHLGDGDGPLINTWSFAGLGFNWPGIQRLDKILC